MVLDLTHTSITLEIHSDSQQKVLGSDDGIKKSLKGRVYVHSDGEEILVMTEVDEKQEEQGLLQIIYLNGEFFNQINLTQIREKLHGE